MNIKSLFNFGRKSATLAASTTKEQHKRFLQYAAKAISRTRQDIASWNNALAQAQSDDPKTFSLQLLYGELELDALLTSQIENRKQQLFSSDFSLKKPDGSKDEDQTDVLRKMAATRHFYNAVLDSVYKGYSLCELEVVKNLNGLPELKVYTLPRTNIVPSTGKFFYDYSEDKHEKYREMKEYGTWILEFDSGGFGLMNKAVPHVLFKRFAQSCWSELCEIYGIPPRVMKTNTQDSIMLRRAEQMMMDMGAAAWFIIDETESFEWAKGTDTNGDVYGNLINLCNNEISLLISGAVIGQDTKHGNRSKEESSQEMLWQLVQSDMALLEHHWNNTIIPALARLGILKGDVRFEFEPAEDIEQLWKMTKEALPFYTVDAEWMKEKFGIEVIGERTTQAAGLANEKLHHGDFFV